jgi:pre-mRNA-splicing factor 18
MSLTILKAEIERKRKQSSSNQEALKSKYIKRGDLEKLREEAYLRKEAEKTKVAAKAIKVQQTQEPEEVLKPPLSDSKIISKLRSLGLPIRLFGETDQERVERLERSEKSEDRIHGKQFTDLIKQNDQNLIEEAMKTHDLKESEKFNVELNEYSQIDTSAISVVLLKNQPKHCCHLLSILCKKIMAEWYQYLNARTDDLKRKPEGKIENVNYEQTKENLKPLFKVLKKQKLTEDVLVKITEMMEFTQLREYVLANDVYILLSIGTAAWPIGVTGTGI